MCASAGESQTRIENTLCHSSTEEPRWRVPCNLQDSASFEEEMGKSEEPLLTLPPLFTKNDEPNDYQFRGYYGNDPPELRTTGVVHNQN